MLAEGRSRPVRPCRRPPTSIVTPDYFATLHIPVADGRGVSSLSRCRWRQDGDDRGHGEPALRRALPRGTLGHRSARDRRPRHIGQEPPCLRRRALADRRHRRRRARRLARTANPSPRCTRASALPILRRGISFARRAIPLAAADRRAPSDQRARAVCVPSMRSPRSNSEWAGPTRRIDCARGCSRCSR